MSVSIDRDIVLGVIALLTFIGILALCWWFRLPSEPQLPTFPTMYEYGFQGNHLPYRQRERLRSLQQPTQTTELQPPEAENPQEISEEKEPEATA